MPNLKPVDSAFAQSAHHVVTVERTIAAPPDRIWAVIDDVGSWTEWYPGMSRCEPTSDPENGLGSTRRIKIGALVADERIIVHDPPNAWAFTVLKTNLPLANRMLEGLALSGDAGGDATTVTYTGAFEPHLLTRLTFSLVRRSVRSAWTRGLDGLAQQVERPTS